MGNTLKPHLENAKKTGVLQVSQSKLERVPEEVFQLQGTLRTLDISKNKIPNINFIVDFKFLKVFNCESNKITSIPADIGNLVKLESLNLSCNSIESIPSSISQLKNLKILNLSSNKLTNFPFSACSSLRNLDAVDLSNNRITDLSDDISDLQALELNLNQNRLCNLSDGLAECPRLKVLRLEENCLPLAAFTPAIMKNSQISLLVVEGNVFQMKEFHNIDGYKEYMDRYTATKKKAL